MPSRLNFKFFCSLFPTMTMLLASTAAGTLLPTQDATSPSEYNDLTYDACIDPKEPPSDEQSAPISQDAASLRVNCDVANSSWKPTTLETASTRDMLTDVSNVAVLRVKAANKSRVTRPPLVSCLRRQAKRSPRAATSVSKQRRVHGLWNNDYSCLFTPLHNDLIVECLSFLDLKDLVAASRVCQRWEHCAQDTNLYESVDATEFVQAQYNKHKDSKRTSQVLLQLLKPHASTMKALTIRSIGQALDPIVFLPVLSNSLRQLTLTGWSSLTDVHVQVMFLSILTKNHLQTLVLDKCPLLTNATIQHVARHCNDLQELSVRDCTKMSNLDALQQSRDTTRTCVTKSSLQSLFAPPASAVGPPATSNSSATLKR